MKRAPGTGGASLSDEGEEAPRDDACRSARDAGGSTSGEAARREPLPPDAVLCDEGELDDIFEALVRLGERPLRVRPADLAALEPWERPRRLFITGVRTGLAQPLPPTVLKPGVVSIAVVDRATNTLCATMLRRGFRYVVRRPVHPEALRLLLRQVLFPGREQRGVARFPFGGEVRWRRGLRRGRCAMSEISAHGCRILTSQRFSLGERLHLRVSSALRDGRSIRLKGRVVRRDLGDPSVKPRRAQIAVAFEGLSSRARADLDALLAERATGPVALRDPELRGDPALARAAQPQPCEASAGQRALGSPAAPVGAAEPPRVTTAPLPLAHEPQVDATQIAPGEAPVDDARGGAHGPSRRRRPRGRWQQEVVALDPEAEQAVDILMGRDLSSGGMRVEPHPALRLGDELKLALYDPEAVEPLVLDARVARDDGRQGWALVFQDLDREGAVRLEQMVDALPPVSMLGADETKPEGVVLGGIVLIKARASGA